MTDESPLPAAAPRQEEGRLQDIAIKVRNARLDWALQSDETPDLIEDLAFVLDQLTARDQALAALVQQWREEAKAGDTEEEHFKSECAERLTALIAPRRDAS